MPDFSIIIPIYNAERTLRRCLDSLASQTDPAFEAILVDDCSTDHSRDICREYAARDTRFRLICMETNSGASSARNAGLEHAAGEFVAFVDSDDFVEPDYLQELRTAFRDADAVFFGCSRISAEGTFLGKRLPQIPAETNYYETLAQLHRQDLFGYTWVKAFRRDAIGQNRFCRELDLLEDEVFACQILAEPRRLKVLDKPIYNYVIGSAGSLMGRTHPDYCRKLDAAYGAWKELLRDYAGKEAILKEQANGDVERCRYYGYERELDPDAFFRSLAESVFFRECTLENDFCDCVRNGDYGRLRRMRRTYRLRTAASNLMKTRRKE